MATTSMDDILSDKEPEPKAPATDGTEAPGEAPERAADAPERPTGRRREHRKKELEAQSRDPNTGQFVKKEPEAAAPEPKAEPKAEAKPEVKAEPKKEEPKSPEKPAVEEMTPREKAAFAKAADEVRKRQAA